MNSRTLLALCIGSTMLFGCPPRESGIERVPPDDSPMQTVIDRVNRNSAGLDFILRGGGVTAEGRIVRDDGGSDSAELHGTMVYRRPRDLYLKLDHILGRMEVGSNDEEFWVWQQFDPGTYWWGRHGGTYDVEATDVPLRPDQLVEVLGLSALPDDTSGPTGPVFRVGSDVYELSFLVQGSDGQLRHDKAILIDRYKPYLITAIIYFSPGGKPEVLAELADYKPVTDSDVLAPRRISLKRLRRGDVMTITFSKMERFDKPGVEQLFSPSPRQRGDADLGRVIRLDQGGPEMMWQSEPVRSEPTTPEEL